MRIGYIRFKFLGIICIEVFLCGICGLVLYIMRGTFGFEFLEWICCCIFVFNVRGLFTLRESRRGRWRLGGLEVQRLRATPRDSKKSLKNEKNQFWKLCVFLGMFLIDLLVMFCDFWIPWNEKNVDFVWDG